MEGNIELKYSMVDIEKIHLIEKINKTLMIILTKPAVFETPIKANSMRMREMPIFYHIWNILL